MLEGSGPIGLRRDPTAQTVRENRPNSRPTRRLDPQVFRIIIPRGPVRAPETDEVTSCDETFAQGECVEAGGKRAIGQLPQRLAGRGACDRNAVSGSKVR